MKEIQCPHCGTHFTINETQYSELLAQVRTAEFDAEVQARLHQALDLAEQRYQNQEQALRAQKDQELSQLQHQIQQFETEKALIQKETETALQGQLTAKDQAIQALEFQLKQAQLEHQQALQTAKTQLEKERDAVANQLALQEKEAQLSRKADQEKYELELRKKDETIEFYKDFKAKQSTKMIGESLEQHCEYEFNRNRMGMFPKAQFGKDNDARTGSKGDYIYREYDDQGVEILSIMFETKN